MSSHWTIWSRGESRPNLCLIRILWLLCREETILTVLHLSRSVGSDFFVTPMTTARRLLCTSGFSRQEYWSVLPCPPPGDLPDPEMEPRSPTLQVDSVVSEPPGEPDCIGDTDKSRSQIWRLCSNPRRWVVVWTYVIIEVGGRLWIYFERRREFSNG